DASYRPGQVLKWLLYHVSELDLYLGVFPFAALLLLTTIGSSLCHHTPRALLELPAFACALSPRVEERNMFYVAPLFLIALLAWIERGMPRPARAAAEQVVIAA